MFTILATVFSSGPNDIVFLYPVRAMCLILTVKEALNNTTAEQTEGAVCDKAAATTAPPRFLAPWKHT